jgi:hypothetical protein
VIDEHGVEETIVTRRLDSGDSHIVTTRTEPVSGVISVDDGMSERTY